MTTTPTIQTPTFRQDRIWTNPVVLGAVGGLLLVLSIVGYVDVRHAGLFAPHVTVSVSCLPDGTSVVDVELAHMPGHVAGVTAYTTAKDGGDDGRWAGGDDVHLDRGAGLYEGVGVPAGVVAVEVTPERQGTLPAQRVDVPKCGRT
jgi:hypothetical protein